MLDQTALRQVISISILTTPSTSRFTSANARGIRRRGLRLGEPKFARRWQTTGQHEVGSSDQADLAGAPHGTPVWADPWMASLSLRARLSRY
jgi:hypothetical protein